jgi:MHS family proline/betaine transporter-like MFS transporter
VDGQHTTRSTSVSPDVPAGIQPPADVQPKVVLAGAVGSIVEYFDFGVYGYVATIIAAKFFISGDETAALLLTLATFGLAFVLRPLGGIIFGHFGDKHGRKNALAATVLLMAVASGLIGVLPTYAAIGVGATALLVLARCMQGIAAGGELGGAASFVAEYAPNSKRGLMCAFVQTGALAGSLLAALVVTLLFTVLGDDVMNDWGWRIPFLIAVPLGVVGLLIRAKLAETPAFEAVEGETTKESAPILELLRDHLAATLRCVGLSILLFSAYYVVYVYVNIHLQTFVGMESRTAFWSTTLCLAVAVACMPLFGALSDRIGRRPVFIGASIAAIVLPLPGFMLLEAGTAGAVGAHVVLGLIDSALMGVALSAYAEMFPTRVRYTGIALGFNVGAALAGGTAPYICTWLVSNTGSSLAPAWFLIGTAVITLLTALKMPETKGANLKAVAA